MKTLKIREQIRKVKVLKSTGMACQSELDRLYLKLDKIREGR